MLGGQKTSTGEVGAAAGAGVLAPSEERGRRCELLKVGYGIGGGMGWRYGEMSWWGLAVRACRCGRERSRGKVLGNEGRGRAHRSPEERRAVAEAASSI